MVNMVNHGSGRVRLEFEIPSRGLIGYRNQFLTDTRGTGIMNSYLKGYEPFKGDFASRQSGSLIADRQGEAVPYGIFGLQPRGKMFIQPGDPVYEGMVVGEHNRDNDLNVNICRGKKLTNIRAASKDENVILSPVTPMTLEKAIDIIRDDELVEVTPKAVRLRKVILPANKR
jgi:GTP-binding protein